jgi:exopolysaccharide biosynthesis galactosyltransferase PssJ
MALVTFIIPVRHQENSKDWSALKRRLSQTVASIAAQSHHDWRGIVVANHGADLPSLPEKFVVERVGFPPNLHHDFNNSDPERVLDAFRLDKGRRVLAGMLSAPDTHFFMIVDDDDFISSKIVHFVSKNTGNNGWYIEAGYRWSEGGRLVFVQKGFAEHCGTSHIIRANLYDLPRRFAEARDEHVKSMLGSHRQVASILQARNTPLESLPFPGAIYRVGHSGAHSKSRRLLQTHLFNMHILKHPRLFLENLRGIRILDDSLRREFFGNGAP